MAEHLSEKQLQSYQRQMLPPDELLMVDDHVQICDICREQLSRTADLNPVFQYLRSDLLSEAEKNWDHVSYEKLASYLDEKLDEVDREIVESHLEICSQCSSEEQDLRTFKSGLSHTVSVKEGFLQFLGTPVYWTPTKILGIAAIFAVLAFAAALPFVMRSNALQAQIRKLETENKKLHSDYKNASSQVQHLSVEMAHIGKSSKENQTVVALNDGGTRIELDEKGRLTATKLLFPDHEKLVKAALTEKTLETPRLLAELIGKKETLMGTPEKAPISLLTPVGTLIQTDQPVFRWAALQGATAYVVKVFDRDFNQVAASPILPDPEWKITKPLKRDAIYSWQVTAIKDGKEVVAPVPPAPEARFAILDSAETIKLEDAKQGHGGSHLILGILYAKAGLLDDAERELDILLKSNPKSEVAAKLLQNVQRLRGQT